MAEALLAAGPCDAPALAALHALAFPPDEAWGADALRLMLELRGAFGLVLPGRDVLGHGRPGLGISGLEIPAPTPVPNGPGPLAGFILARVAADEMEVLTLAVAPAARRHGLGLVLLEGAMALAAARGATIAFLEVSTGNVAGLALYNGAGFAEVGRRRRYYADGSDALVLSHPCAR